MTKNSLKYRVSVNEQYNSTEVSFPEKPSQDVINALKTVKYRWNHVKSCWYGFLTADELKTVISTPAKAQAIANAKLEERKKVWAEKKAQKKAETETAKPETKKATLTARGKALVEKDIKAMTVEDVKKASKPATKKDSAKKSGKSKK